MKTLLLITTSLLLIGSAFAKKESKKVYEINWLLAHDPVSLFEEAATSFADKVKKRTNGEVKINIMTVSQYTKGKKKTMSPNQVLAHLVQGRIQMTQIYTTSLGAYEPTMWVLDLPFLFRDHDHATGVLDGKIGSKLLAKLDKYNMKGLAFTYSGGFRVLPTTNKPINSVTDLKGLRVRTSTSPVARELFDSHGALAIPMTLDKAKQMTQNGLIEAVETTYPRVYSVGQEKSTKYMNETKHSLFLTSMIMNKQFFKAIPSKHQDIIRKTALEVAKLERDISVADGVKTRKKLIKQGYKVVVMSKAEVVKFKKSVQPIYKKFEPMFGKKLISDIKNFN